MSCDFVMISNPGGFVKGFLKIYGQKNEISVKSAVFGKMRPCPESTFVVY